MTTIRRIAPQTLANSVGIDPGINNIKNQVLPLHVPAFQRPYKWETTGDKHVQTLWNSIFGAIHIVPNDNGPDTYNLDVESEYPFLGAVVLSKPSDDGADDHLEIVDGQQRITTHLIIAAVLRDYALNLIKNNPDLETRHKNDSRDIAKQIQKVFMSDGDGEDGPNSTFYFHKQESRAEEKEWFQKRIQSFPLDVNDEVDLWSEWDPPHGRANTNSDETKCMWKAYTTLQKSLISHFKAIGCNGRSQAKIEGQIAEIIKMANKLASQTSYCFTEVNSLSSAYLLFETLNNTGLDLSLGDLFKNLLFMQCDQTGPLRKQGAKKWKEVENALDLNPIPDFLRYRHIKDRSKNITMSKLYPDLKSKLEQMPKSSLKDQELPELAKDAVHYGEILLVNKSIANGMDCALYRQLRTFNLFNYKMTHPILIAGWKHCDIDDKKIKLIKLLENFMFQFSTLGERASNLLESDSAFPTFACNLKNAISFDEGYQELKESLLGIFDQHTIDFNVGWDVFANRKNAISKVKPFLYRIEEHINPKLRYDQDDAEFEEVADQLKDTSAIHVEHIFPKKWEGHWNDFDPENEEQEYWVNHIGNLCLLGGKYNKKASNYSLEDKKGEDHGVGYSGSKFIVPKELMEMNEWTATSIRENAKRYKEAAEEIWGTL